MLEERDRRSPERDLRKPTETWEKTGARTEGRQSLAVARQTSGRDLRGQEDRGRLKKDRPLRCGQGQLAELHIRPERAERALGAETVEQSLEEGLDDVLTGP